MLKMLAAPGCITNLPNSLKRACALACSVLAFASVTAQARDLRLECDAFGANDTTMHARYEERDSGRRKFSTEFEAAPNGPYAAGQRMVALVDGVKVGAVRLKTVVGGDLVGDLNLDSTAGAGDDAKPFPSDFPPVDRGTKVVVRINNKNVLGCRLQR
jgi:hypothetical protein